jgi:hypothetical protein
MICLVGWQDFRHRLYLQQKNSLKIHTKAFFFDILSQKQFGAFFINFFLLEFLKSNFIFFSLQKVRWLANNFVYLYNFYCLYDVGLSFTNDFFNEQNFRFVEIIKTLMIFVEWP